MAGRELRKDAPYNQQVGPPIETSETPAPFPRLRKGAREVFPALKKTALASGGKTPSSPETRGGPWPGSPPAPFRGKSIPARFLPPWPYPDSASGPAESEEGPR